MNNKSQNLLSSKLEHSNKRVSDSAKGPSIILALHAKFGIKTFEFCYLEWATFGVIQGMTQINLQIVTVIKVEKRHNQGHTLWMANFRNYPELARFLNP